MMEAMGGLTEAQRESLWHFRQVRFARIERDRVLSTPARPAGFSAPIPGTPQAADMQRVFDNFKS